tara:strand:+ start:280789 stop:281361 length:573 start_codon:yes stop_codon:yes gene_type:complete
MSDGKYEKMCNLWIKSHTWQLDDAISILIKQLPSAYMKSYEDSENDKRIFFKTLAQNNLGGILDLHSAIPGDAPSDIRINPIQFIEWLESLNYPLPLAMKQAKDNYLASNGKPSRKLTPTQIHKHRCRSLAAYFWKQDPDLTKVEMAKKSELIKIACENKIYSSKTIEGWIKDLNPDRSQGRRKSQDTPL